MRRQLYDLRVRVQRERELRPDADVVVVWVETLGDCRCEGDGSLVLVSESKRGFV